MWGLQVNVDKTKIMVFRKRGKITDNEKLYYDKAEIEVVNRFNYLGTVIYYTGSFTSHRNTVIGKGVKAMNALLSHTQKYDLTINTYLQLFDSFVGSILNYSCEIWCSTNNLEFERLHLKYCKRLLRVKPRTSNASIYGETGRYPLYIN